MRTIGVRQKVQQPSRAQEASGSLIAPDSPSHSRKIPPGRLTQTVIMPSRAGPAKSFAGLSAM